MVRAVRGTAVRVQAYGPGNCERCASGQGCGGGILSRLIGHRRPDVEADSRVADLRVGDTVIVGIPEDALVSASIRVYLLPLVAMFGFGAFAHHILEAHELLVALFALAGLAAAFLALRVFNAKAERSGRFRPVVLRKDAPDAGRCARIG